MHSFTTLLGLLLVFLLAALVSGAVAALIAGTLLEPASGAAYWLPRLAGGVGGMIGALLWIRFTIHREKRR